MEIRISGANIVRTNWDYSKTSVQTKDLLISDYIEGVVRITIDDKESLISVEELLAVVKMFRVTKPLSKHK